MNAIREKVYDLVNYLLGISCLREAFQALKTLLPTDSLPDEEIIQKVIDRACELGDWRMAKEACCMLVSTQYAECKRVLTSEQTMCLLKAELRKLGEYSDHDIDGGPSLFDDGFIKRYRLSCGECRQEILKLIAKEFLRRRWRVRFLNLMDHEFRDQPIDPHDLEKLLPKTDASLLPDEQMAADVVNLIKRGLPLDRVIRDGKILGNSIDLMIYARQGKSLDGLIRLAAWELSGTIARALRPVAVKYSAFSLFMSLVSIMNEPPTVEELEQLPKYNDEMRVRIPTE